MKKFIIPVIALLFVATTANANPRLKNQKHFGKDFDPNKKVEVPMTTLAELNKGPQYKNFGHIQGTGDVVDLDNKNTLKGPQYKNQKHFAAPVGEPQNIKPEIAGR